MCLTHAANFCLFEANCFGIVFEFEVSINSSTVMNILFDRKTIRLLSALTAMF